MIDSWAAFALGFLVAGIVAAFLVLAMHMDDDKRVAGFIADIHAYIHCYRAWANAAPIYKTALQTLTVVASKDEGNVNVDTFDAALEAAREALAEGDRIVGGAQ